MEGEGRTSFDRKLEDARRRAGLEGGSDAADASPAPPSREPHPLTVAGRIGAEVVATLAVAVAIGYGLDRLLGTRPWLMIAMVPVGLAAGVRNLLRLASPGSGSGGGSNGGGK